MAPRQSDNFFRLAAYDFQPKWRWLTLWDFDFHRTAGICGPGRFVLQQSCAAHVCFVPKAEFPLPLAGGGLGEGRLQRHVLHSFALREPRERLLQDHPLEVRRLLVRLERGFVAEHLVEQELRRIGHTPVRRYQLYARFLARLRKEARDDVGAGVRLTVPRPPRHGERQLAVLTGLHVILFSVGSSACLLLAAINGSAHPISARNGRAVYPQKRTLE